MEFRLDFFFRIFMDGLYYLTNLLFFQIIFLHTPLLGGWNEKQMHIFVASYLVVDGLVMSFFSNNMWWLPIFVNRGDLDYYLIRPVSSLFFLSLREFAVNSFFNLLLALSILVWALSTYPTAFSWQQLIAYLFFLINGTFLYYCLRILLIIPIFWTHSSRGMDEIFWGLTRCMERPDRIFRGFFRLILTTVLPFSLMSSFPARLIIEGISLPVITHILVVTLFFSLILGFCWKKGLENYSSASS